MPKFFFDSTDQIPEDMRPKATQDADGKFVLDLSETSKVADFRDNNNRLKSEIEGLQGFKVKVRQVIGVEGDEDPDLDGFGTELEGLRGIQKQVTDGKLIADSSLDQAVEKRTGEMKTSYETRLRDQGKLVEQGKRDVGVAQARLQEYVVQSEITRSVLAADSDVNPSALHDILNRAKGVFRTDPEKLTVAPYGSDNQPMYGEDPTKVMTVKEWIQQQVQEAPYLSKASFGGGSGGNGGGKSGKTQSNDRASSMPTGNYFEQRKKEIAEENDKRARR